MPTMSLGEFVEDVRFWGQWRYGWSDRLLDRIAECGEDGDAWHDGETAEEFVERKERQFQNVD